MPGTHPNPDRPLYLGMREGDLAGKPYARFWNPRMAPLPAHVREAVLHGPVAAGLLPRLGEAPRMLEAGHAELEDGYGLQDDGSLLVAVRTEMPDVTPAMVDWWFGWHSEEPQRYKLWHPRAHVHAQWDVEDRALRGRARYLGRTSFIDEYLGSQLSHLTIRFVPPAELGFDEAQLADPQQATVVCARAGFFGLPVGTDAGYLVHHVRRVPGGAEMRSRFWLGGPHAALRSGGKVAEIAMRAVRRFVRPTAANGHELLVHCSQEMAHLAAFLPALHAALQDD